MRFSKTLLVCFSMYFPILVACFVLICTGRVSLSTNGFGIDSSGNLYIGKESKIEVYDNGDLTYTIDPVGDRDYTFTIEDDKILLSNSVNVYEMDLNGKVISKRKDTHAQVFNSLQNKKNYTTAAEDTYILRGSWGRTEIVLYGDNESPPQMIYQMPVLDYLVKIAILFVIVSIVVIIPVNIYISERKVKQEEIIHIDN